MSLNIYKEEAKAFLVKINAQGEGSMRKVALLDDEFQILKESIEVNDTDKIRHQIYDMLFLLFEISADYDVDLDNEWEAGREKKVKKYI